MPFFKAFFFSLFLSLPLSAAPVTFDETVIQVPFKESNEHHLSSTRCLTRNHLFWDVCFAVNPKDEMQFKSFKFKNSGVNKIVPMEGFNLGREYEFMFEDLARSDMGLLLWDSPDEYESHAHLKIMFFFPRDILPAIRYESDEIIVTLPTKEEVVYDAKTLEIRRGVLKEGPIKQNAKGEALAPNVEYTGSGVVIEASALADWPIGFNAINAKKIVTIKKKGQKNCLVPGQELWFTDSKKGNNVFFNKKLISNDAFDTYLLNRCKFSLY